MPFLGLLDTSGIQRFLYQSPKLRSIAAASEYIEAMTKKPNGLFHSKVDKVSGAEVLVTAGGNAAIRTETREQMECVFRCVSRALLEDGNGLEIVGAIKEYETGQLALQYRAALQELERRKLTQARSVPFVLPGCAPSRPRVLAEMQAPKHVFRDQLEEPLDVDDMLAIGFRVREGHETTKKEQFGLIAVVSVDGLSMGKRVLRWLIEQETQQTEEEEFVRVFRAWSLYIKRRWEGAWAECLGEIEAAFSASGRKLRHPDYAMSDRWLQLQARRPDEAAGYYLPCRRIYQGGDDMVFVCDARIALTLATALAARLETEVKAEDVPTEFQRIPVSVGTVFVDSHFPFSRAHALSESVREAAKKAAAVSKSAVSYVNWWINRQGALEPFYPSSSLKPYCLRSDPMGDRRLSWEDLEQRILPGMWSSFSDCRNKLKDILAAADANQAEDGADAVRTLLAARPLEKRKGLEFLVPFQYGEYGFDNQRNATPLLDAGELFDFHFPYTRVQDPIPDMVSQDTRSSEAIS